MLETTRVVGGLLFIGFGLACLFGAILFSAMEDQRNGNRAVAAGFGLCVVGWCLLP